MMPKYKLTRDAGSINGIRVYRIQALRDFSDVKAGDEGGVIQSESNLSHDGDCWVYDRATISENVSIQGNIKIMGDVSMYGDIQISGNGLIIGDY